MPADLFDLRREAAGQLFAAPADADEDDAALRVFGFENLMGDSPDDAVDLLRRHQRALANGLDGASHRSWPSLRCG